MKISEVMTPDPACCTAADSTQKAAIIMRELSVGIVPVVDTHESRKLVGVITDRDLCIEIVAAGDDPKEIRLDEVMTDELVTCHPDDDVEAVLELMRDNQVRRVPVIDSEGRIAGIVSTADMVLCGELNADEIDETLQDISEPSLEEFRHLTELATFHSNDGAGPRLNDVSLPPPQDPSSGEAAR